MKFVIYAIILNLIIIGLSNSRVSCEKGFHKSSGDDSIYCLQNSKNCEVFDSNTLNCIECKFHSKKVHSTTQGDYCLFILSTRFRHFICSGFILFFISLFTYLYWKVIKVFVKKMCTKLKVYIPCLRYIIKDNSDSVVFPITKIDNKPISNFSSNSLSPSKLERDFDPSLNLQAKNVLEQNFIDELQYPKSDRLVIRNIETRIEGKRTQFRSNSFDQNSGILSSSGMDIAVLNFD